jgi:hypothetical protein
MRPLRLALWLPIALAASFTSAQAQTLATYDTFSSPLLNDTKWAGVEQAISISGGPAVNLEFTRRVLQGQLQLTLRTAGGTGSDTGITGEGRNGLRINHPVLADEVPRITALQAKITVAKASAGDCAANPGNTNTRARAQLFGFFFNDGSSSGAGDRTGDILAGVTLERRAGGDGIFAFMNRCTTASCTTSDNIDVETFTHVWQVGTPELVTVRWVKASKKFVFVLGSGAGAETKEISYDGLGWTDTAKPRLFLKEARVSNAVENCTAGRVEAFMDARFDTVKINQTAVDALP